MENTNQYRLYVGIDVAARTFTVAWSQPDTEASKPVTLPQTPEGYHQLHQQLGALAIPPAATLIVLEATSSYWITLAVTLQQFGYAVSVLNP